MGTASKGNKIDMLSGPLASRMVLFALPLIASGVLQQSFNSVDVAVVGRFAGSHALAAVGSNGPVISLLINMFLGLSVGVNVVIANYIGQRNSRGVRAAVASSVVLALLSGLTMLVLSQLIARPVLTWLDTPAEVLDDAVLYLRLLGLGMPFMIIYNFGSAILRSIGDTRRPFYILVLAGIVNVILNLVLVIGCDMGVAGVAIGTVVSNIVNATLITIILMREKSDIRVDLKAIVPSRVQIGKICNVGVPAGIQTTVFALSNAFILSAINSFGADAAAGSAAALNYELYCYFVISAFAQTAVAFISQNYGAGNLDRCRRIFRLSLAMSMGTSVVLNLLLAWLHEPVLRVFTTDIPVLHYGGIRMTYVLAFQFIACYYEMAGSAMRGLGHSMTPALITIFGTCVLRLFWVWNFPVGEAEFRDLMIVYPLSWILTDLLMFIAFARIRRGLGTQAKNPQL